MKTKISIWIFLLFLMGALTLLTTSCDKEDDGNGDAQTIEIGTSYGGGIIFYVDGTGKHGLIAALNDQTSAESIAWGCEGTYISGTGTAVGTGKTNTTAIVAGCNATGLAARLCDQLELNGYSDWFLPSKDELNLMYQNLHAQGLGNFSNFLYWSSSEVDADNIWAQNFWDESPFFDPGGQYVVGKVGDMFARAIRSF
jgi:hypothetical protein